MFRIPQFQISQSRVPVVFNVNCVLLKGIWITTICSLKAGGTTKLGNMKPNWAPKRFPSQTGFYFVNRFPNCISQEEVLISDAIYTSTTFMAHYREIT